MKELDKKKSTKQTKPSKGQSASGKKKKHAEVSALGKAYITSTFNNTLVTLTNNNGDTVSWSSAGARGFKGTRRSTPYAATLAMEDAAKKAVERGMKSVEVFVKGPGAGRDAALRAIRAAGLSISMIADITPIPHNGPRAKKKRRV